MCTWQSGALLPVSHLARVRARAQVRDRDTGRARANDSRLRALWGPG